MKEPARAIHKGFCFNSGFHPQSKIEYGSFKTIPNPLRQLPVKNLIIPEAPLKSICFKGLNSYEFRSIFILDLDH
jgi:hypothetical protein